MHIHTSFLHKVVFCTRSKGPFAPPTFHTIVSFLFPKEYRDFLSFLVLCDVGEESAGEDKESGNMVVGLGVTLLHGEVGAD